MIASTNVISIPQEPVAQVIGAGSNGQLSGRLISLDAYRGLIMLLLISDGLGLASLGHHSSLAWIAPQMDHSEWIGCTLWDLIQPAFTFMAGVAMPFAFARRMARGESFMQLLGHVAKRSILLIVISNILSNIDGGHDRPVFQLINVLAQLGLGYFLCFLITRLPFRFQVVSAVLLLAGYWGLFVMFPGPQGPFSPTGNIGLAIDKLLLGYNYSGGYATINFIGNAVTILFGCWAGDLLRSGKANSYKLKVLLGAGVTALLLGLALAPVNPMIKRLWTASFTFYSGGFVVFGLSAFFWVVEMKQRVRWTFPMLVLGVNSLFIYCLWHALSGWINRSLGVFTGRFWYLQDFGVIPQMLLVVLVMWSACYVLYRRNFLLKI